METDSDDIPDNDVDNSPDWDDSGASCYNTYIYHKCIRMMLSCGLSLRDSAKCANGLMEDLMELGELRQDDSLFLTKSKVERQMDKIGKIDAEEHAKNVIGIKSIGHDGKASKCLQPNCQTKVESKVTFIDNVERRYVTHTIPADGTGASLADSLYEVIFASPLIL